MNVADIEKVTSAVFGLLSGWGETPISWPGADRDTRKEAEWIEPDVVGFDEDPARAADTWTEAEAQVKVFVRDNGGNTYRAREIAQKAHNLLAGSTVPLSSGNSVRLRRGSVDRIGEVQEVEGLIVRVPVQIQGA